MDDGDDAEVIDLWPWLEDDMIDRAFAVRRKRAQAQKAFKLVEDGEVTLMTWRDSIERHREREHPPDDPEF